MINDPHAKACHLIPIMTVIFIVAACVLWAVNAHADTKCDISSCNLHNEGECPCSKVLNGHADTKIDCSKCCRGEYENGMMRDVTPCADEAVQNDMHWVQAIQESNKRLVEQLKTSREREEITGRLVAELVEAMKKLDFQIDVLTKAVLTNAKE